MNQPFPQLQISPDALVAEARRKHRPIKSYCLFSGGNDSTVLAHRCRDHYDSLFHIDTGTAVPGVLSFVQRFANWVDKPLVIYSSAGWFEKLVLGGWTRPSGEIAEPLGFPGPGQHGRVFSILKERRIEDLVRDTKLGYSRDRRVLLLSGKRREESARRKKTTAGIERKWAQVYANPLIDWTGVDMREYRAQHRIPQSDVAALLHRSGECNCGAFASAAEERAMLKSLWPLWWAWVEDLERRAEAMGIRWCRWGGYDLEGNRAKADPEGEPTVGYLCQDCPTEFQLEMAA